MPAAGTSIFKVTDEVCRNVENMAGRGVTMPAIAAQLGISESTAFKYQKKNAEFAEAIKRGRAKGVIAYTDHLYQQSKAGKVAATIFALINLDPENWKQRPPEYANTDIPINRIEIVTVDGRKPKG